MPVHAKQSLIVKSNSLPFKKIKNARALKKKIKAKQDKSKRYTTGRKTLKGLRNGSIKL